MAGALGVVITTDVPMSGQHAQPVYVDESLPIVGPSRAIVVTSGEVPQMGGPALPVRLAPTGTPALGPALPVYVVSGSLGGVSAPSSLLTGLVAYWPMNEASGNRADSSGSGFTLTDNNTVTSNTGILSNAAEFVTANSEYLSIADNATLRGGLRDFCLDGWLYIASPSTAQYILSKGSGTTAATLEYAMVVTSSSVIWRVYVGSTTFSTAGQAIVANTWTYVCAWFDSAAGLSWFQTNNNTPVSVAVVGTPNTLAQPFRIGSSGVPSLYTGGRIDEVGRWNRVLTGTERADRYNAGAGRAYPFDSPRLWGQTDVPVYSGSFTYSSTIES